MADRREIWNMTERTRRGYIVFSRNTAINHLTKQIQPVLNASETRSIPQLEDNLDSFIDIQPAFDLNVQIYNAVAKTFAKTVFNGLKSANPGLFQKAEFPELNFEREVRNYFESDAAKLIKAETETTKEEIRKILIQAQEQSIPPHEARKFIQDKVKPIIRRRGEVIGRTETVRASNWGSLEGANKASIETRKEWISTFDARTRGSPLDEVPDIYDHWSMDGQIREREGSFQEPRTGERLSYPSDPMASPGNTIQCRCTLAFRPI